MKTKAERQRWWRSLTPQQQFDYVEKLVAGKAVLRCKESLRVMAKFGDKFKCSECFHRTTKACTDDLPCGCQWYWNPITGLQGPKLEAQRSKNLVKQ